MRHILNLTGINVVKRNIISDDETGREEMRRELSKCQRRLKRSKLQYSTLEHETVKCQASTLRLFKTLSVDEAIVRDKIRSALVIEREVEKYSCLIDTMEDQVSCIFISQFLSSFNEVLKWKDKMI